MPIGHLWFVLRGADIKGPYPAALIERNIALGRIKSNDAISADGQSWVPAHQYPDFELHQHADESDLRRRRFDERQQNRRRTQAAPAIESRAGADRRASEMPDVVAHREQAQRIWNGLKPPRLDARRAILGLVGALAGLFIVAGLLRQPKGPAAVDCAAAPAPRVVWDSCERSAAQLVGVDLSAASLRNTSLIGANLRGAHLAGANLNYANLTTANLAGADLRGAVLTGATLREADLTGANLTDANLEFSDLTQAHLDNAIVANARLGHALWHTGTVCAAESRGACVLAPP